MPGGETRIVVRLVCGHEILEVRGPGGEAELRELQDGGGRLHCTECRAARGLADFFAVDP